MNALKRLSKVLESAEQILFDDSSKIVVMSDCHRGDGSRTDNFSKNQNIYYAALTHYYNENYTYIELGDGDELWENNNFTDIMYAHSDVFWLMSKFYNQGRLYFTFGNHDMVKKNSKFISSNFYYYYDQPTKKYNLLFENLKIYEGLVLKYTITGDKILLLHGHQASFMDYNMWKLRRFLVRYLWRPLELFGVNDPTSTAKNYRKKELIGRRLNKWVEKENQMLIAGHTHKPTFPEVGEAPYFNDGSCVHPRCITAIEIEDGNIALVKWCVKTKNDGTLVVGREVLAGPRELKDYFKYFQSANQ